MADEQQERQIIPTACTVPEHQYRAPVTRTTFDVRGAGPGRLALDRREETMPDGKRMICYAILLRHGESQMEILFGSWQQLSNVLQVLIGAYNSVQAAIARGGN
jgi:hypothetical protein